MLDVMFTSFSAFMGDAPTKLNPKDLLTLFTDLPQTLISLADKLTAMQQVDVNRAMSALWERPLLDSIVVQSVPDSMTLKNESIAALVFALLEGEGQAMRANTQLMMAEIGLRLLSVDVGGGPRIDKGVSTDAERVTYLVAAGLWRDVLSLFEQEVASKQELGGALEDNRTRSIKIRTDMLKSGAITLGGRVVAGYLRVAKAMLAWLESPPIKLALRGRVAADFERLRVDAAAAISELNNQFPTYWELFTQTAFDAELLGAWTLAKQLPHGTHGGPEGPPSPLGGSVLIDDVIWPVSIPAGAIDAWISAMWDAIEQAQFHARMLMPTMSDAVSPLRTPTSLDIDTAEPTEYVLDIRPTSGMPYLNQVDLRVFLPDSERLLRRLGLTQWVVRTAAEIRDLVANTESLRDVPVLIEGGPGTTIVPVFRDIDEDSGAGRFDADENGLKSITLALGTTPHELQTWLSGYTGNTSRSLRLLADRLHLCGALATGSELIGGPQTSEGAKLSVTIVAPTTNFYYHSRSHGENYGEPILLGVLASGESLYFLPFRTIPLSAHVDRFESNLTTEVSTDTIPGPSYAVSWMADSEARPSKVVIAGWRHHHTEVKDVVLVRSYSGFAGFQVLLGAKGQIAGARCSNAVLWPGEAAPTWSPMTTELPVSAFRLTRS
jgi:hypothetical protein